MRVCFIQAFRSDLCLSVRGSCAVKKGREEIPCQSPIAGTFSSESSATLCMHAPPVLLSQGLRVCRDSTRNAQRSKCNFQSSKSSCGSTSKTRSSGGSPLPTDAPSPNSSSRTVFQFFASHTLFFHICSVAFFVASRFSQGEEEENEEDEEDEEEQGEEHR